MGNSASMNKSDRDIIKDQIVTNKQIEKQIAKEKSLQWKIMKVLLLGGPKCGKTTIFKQMKILHLDGFTKSDLINFRYLVYSNLLKAVTQLIDGLKSFNIPLDVTIKEDVKMFGSFCSKVSRDEQGFDIELTKDVSQRIQRIWRSQCVQKVYENRFSMDLLLCTERYLNNLERLSSPAYLPDDQDILLCRKQTVGVQEISFTFKDLIFNMVDVGGQKSERRKWIHCFDNVDLILFIVAMCDYDVKSEDFSEKNSLLESLEIFESIANNKHLRKAAMVLFLNKKDVFEEKIVKGSSLQVCFPDFNGPNTFDIASKFISDRFGEKMRNKHSLHTHLTTATNSKNVDLVFGSVIDHIVKKNLDKAGVVV